MAELGGSDGQLFCKFAVAEDFDRELVVGNQAGFDQGGGVDRCAGGELFQVGEIDDVKSAFEVFVEQGDR